jgi:hypothetical protein
MFRIDMEIIVEKFHSLLHRKKSMSFETLQFLPTVFLGE